MMFSTYEAKKFTLPKVEGISEKTMTEGGVEVSSRESGRTTLMPESSIVDELTRK